MPPKELSKLIGLYLNGKCNPAEKEQLERWYGTYQITEKEFYGEEEDLIASSAERSLVNLHLKIKLAEPKKRSWTNSSWLRYAAILFIIFCAGLLLVYKNSNQSAKNYYANDIAPGKNKALLTLADGTKIALDNALNGQIGEQSGIKITKTKDGQVVYTIDSSSNHMPAATANLLNTIATPRGGQYQIKLPDGTMVWLNAASSLKFPASFHGVKERLVTLTGEGYFEVAKNKEVPFIVHTEKQDVQVLGTHFNINSYPDEGKARTTLLEGSVRVLTAAKPINGVVLKPGQQSTLLHNQITIKELNVEDATAWKNGKFKFVNENIHDLMKRIARWYNVEVIYEGNMANKDFSGSVSRFENVSKILDILESTNTVHFKVEGRRITVMP